MINEKKKMTAQGSSVGADDGQSISTNSKVSIPVSGEEINVSGEEINDEIVNSPERLEEMYRRMQRMADPRYLHTLAIIRFMSFKILMLNKSDSCYCHLRENRGSPFSL